MKAKTVKLYQGLFFLVLFFSLPPSFARSLNQAAFNPTTNSYEFGYQSVNSLNILNAPKDTDWNRWATVHDGKVYRLFFFKQGSNNILYQFGYNPQSFAFQYGYKSIPTLELTNIPIDADSNRLMMLYDKKNYRLFLPKLNQPSLLYQFALNPKSKKFEFGYQSIPNIQVTGMPLDTDWSRSAVLHDGQDYRFVAMKKNNHNMLYHAAFHQSKQNFIYGYRSRALLGISTIPLNSDLSSFSMLHDGSHYRLYFLSRY